MTQRYHFALWYEISPIGAKHLGRDDGTVVVSTPQYDVRYPSL